MAKNVIEIVIKASDQASAVLKGVGGSLQSLGSVALVGLGAAAAAVTGLGVAAFKSGQTYEGALATMAGATGATGAELDALGEIARNVFRTMPVDMDSTAAAIGELNTRLGVSGGELEGVTRQLLDFARVHKLDAGPAAQMTGKLIAALGMDASDAGGLLDKLTLAGQMSGISVANLGQYILDAGPSFEELGFDLDRSIALFASFEKAGARPEEVIGSMTKALNTLAAEGFTNAREGFEEYISRIAEAPDILEATTIANELFGARVGAKVAEDIRAGRFEVDEWAAAIAGAEGTLASAAAATMTFGERVQVFKNKATDALVPVGESMLRLADTVLQYLSPAFDKLASDVLPAVVAVVDGVLQAFELFFVGIGEGMPFIENLEFLIFDLAQVFGMSKEAAYDLAFAVSDFVQQVADALAPIIAWVAENVKLEDVLIGLAIAIGVVVVGALKALLVAVAPVVLTFLAVTAIVAALRAAWENNFLGIQDITASVLEFVNNAIATARAWWAQNGDAILAKATEIWTTVKTTITDLLGAAGDFIKATVDNIKAWWAEHGDAIMAKATEIWQGVVATFEWFKGQFTGIFSAFRSAFEGDWHSFGEKLREVWDAAWQKIQQILESAWSTLSEIAAGIVDSIIGFFTETDWGAVGTAIIQGIANGISNAVGMIADAAKGAAQAAYDAARGFLGAKSPSRLFEMQVGAPIAQGMALGIQRNINLPAGAAREMAQTTYDHSRHVALTVQPTEYRREGTLADEARWAATLLGVA